MSIFRKKKEKIPVDTDVLKKLNKMRLEEKLAREKARKALRESDAVVDLCHVMLEKMVEVPEKT